jgi:hypothetical protein
MKFILTICLLFLFSSCIEIWDDLTLNNDGSGNLKYKINLSESKIKVNSILALDSIDGKPVPSKSQISSKINEFVKLLDAQVGISNVLVEENYTDYIFKFSCDFTSVTNLQDGIKLSLAQISNDKWSQPNDQSWLSWDGNTLVRTIPAIFLNKLRIINLKTKNCLRRGSILL